MIIFAVQTAERLLVRRDIEGAVSLVDHHARPGARGFFDVFDARVVHRDIAAALRLRVIRREQRGLMQALVVKRAVLGAENDMAAV